MNLIAQIQTPSGMALNVTFDQAREAGASEADIAAALQTIRREAVKAECKRRIYAVASPETQMNMASMAAVIGAKAVSARSDQEKGALAAFEASLAWVQSMRAAVGPLVEDPKMEIAADASWPKCPKEVLALAGSF